MLAIESAATVAFLATAAVFVAFSVEQGPCGEQRPAPGSPQERLCDVLVTGEDHRLLIYAVAPAAAVVAGVVGVVTRRRRAMRVAGAVAAAWLVAIVVVQMVLPND